MEQRYEWAKVRGQGKEEKPGEIKSRAKVFRKKDICWAAGKGHSCPGRRQARVTEDILMLGFPFLILGRDCGLTFKSNFVLMFVADARHRDRCGHCL